MQASTEDTKSGETNKERKKQEKGFGDGGVKEVNKNNSDEHSVHTFYTKTTQLVV